MRLNSFVIGSGDLDDSILRVDDKMQFLQADFKNVKSFKLIVLSIKFSANRCLKIENKRVNFIVRIELKSIASYTRLVNSHV